MASLHSWLAIGVVAAASVVGGAEAWAQSRNLWLRHGQSTVISGYFYPGENIWAICDLNCDDLDLVLYDAKGRVVDADDLSDDYPVVQAPHEGNFSVRVIMYYCTQPEGCAVTVDSDYGF